METKYLPFDIRLWQSAVGMFLRSNNRKKDGKDHRYFSIVEEEQQEYANLSLFPDDREIPADAVDSLQVKVSGLELRRPRVFGSCWLGCELWRQLGLDEFWGSRLAGWREELAKYPDNTQNALVVLSLNLTEQKR